jgi:hypothetical protein
MATFTDVYKQELKSKGILSSLGSTAFKRTKERLDPRNMLFGGSGILAASGKKIFGKGYQALDRTPGKKLSETGTFNGEIKSEVLNSLLMSSQNQEAQLSIIAKNSMNNNAMARDMNVMRQNIMKLVTMGGGKASRASDMFFRDSAARETAYENQIAKNKLKTSPTVVNKTDESKDGVNKGLLGALLGIGSTIASAVTGALSSIPSLISNIFSVENIGKMLGIGADVMKGLGSVFRLLLPIISNPVFLALAGALVSAKWLMDLLDRKNAEANTPEKTQQRVETDAGSNAAKGAADTASRKIDQGLRDVASGNYTDQQVQLYTGGVELPDRTVVGGIKSKKELQDAIKKADSEGKKMIDIGGPTAAEQAKEVRMGPAPTKMTLLDAIAKGESAGAGGYDAMNQGTVGLGGKVIGSGNSEKIINKKLTDMTIGEIMDRAAKPSDNAQKRKADGLIFAAGRYQIIPETLKNLVDAGIASRNEKFSPEVQDRLGMELIRKTGALKMASEGNYNDAQNALAKVWAGIPLATDTMNAASGRMMKAGQSYYAGPGNKAHAGSGKDVRSSLMAFTNQVGSTLSETTAEAARLNMQAAAQSQSAPVVINQQTPAPQTQSATQTPVASVHNLDPWVDIWSTSILNPAGMGA